MIFFKLLEECKRAADVAKERTKGGTDRNCLWKTDWRGFWWHTDRI